MRPAAFLDRDGTIIRQVHHLTDPAEVELLPGASSALRELRRAGFACVVVSNQSAVGRGVLTLDGLAAVHDEFRRQLAAEGAEIDGWYFCPEIPRTSDRSAVDHPERKPAPGMLLRAARELTLDIGSSWMVGDMVSDILAGRNAGCRGSILVRTGHGAAADDAAKFADHVVADLSAAVALILQDHRTHDRASAVPPDAKMKEHE